MLKKELVSLPDSVCFMVAADEISGTPSKFSEVVSWCKNLGIFKVIFHIDTDNVSSVIPHLDTVRGISGAARLNLFYDDRVERLGEEGGMTVTVAVGMSGREEIASAVKRMAADKIAPEDVTEDVLESYLKFRVEPDFVIKTGGSHLTDFLIWQSVYSELFFLDVNWDRFREIDFLRALRDYQIRKRRYGA
jgi:undecaprenyl diphosphate synthase